MREIFIEFNYGRIWDQKSQKYVSPLAGCSSLDPKYLLKSIVLIGIFEGPKFWSFRYTVN